MENHAPQQGLKSVRMLVIGLVSVLVIAALIFIVRLTTWPQPAGLAAASKPDALATSSDRCVECHRKASPGIVEQFGHSTMAASKVGCRDCHEVASN